MTIIPIIPLRSILIAPPRCPSARAKSIPDGYLLVVMRAGHNVNAGFVSRSTQRDGNSAVVGGLVAEL